jgi:hypothetical protein
VLYCGMPFGHPPGMHDSMMQAIHASRPGGSVGYVGVPHGSSSTARSCSSLMSTSMAALRRCAATCPNLSTWC